MNEQLHYVYDAAGNLNYRTNNALVQNFQVNALNELTANTNGGTLTVMGTTTSVATNVTVNSSNAAPYGDATFAATNMPLTTTYTAIAADHYGRHSTNTVTVNISTNNALFQYDGNGNLIYDGLRSFAYDGENELIQVWVTNQWFSQFSYDGKMRRRIRQEYTWQNSGWVQTNQVYYVYDGNVVIQERDINNLPSTTYTRGLDLSSRLQGAGGIGGLLAMTLNTGSGPASSNSMYYHSDGNGNVTMLVNSWQYIVAKYLYDAFGNTLSAAGTLAQANLYRFSSKEAHPNSGLVYYLYRYYDPNLQRWPNKDPLEERGGINLYGFVQNEPTDLVDSDGTIAGVDDIYELCLLDAAAASAIGIYCGSGQMHRDMQNIGNALNSAWDGVCEMSRPRRNANRPGHRGGNNPDKHQGAQGHGGSRPPNFTPTPRRPVPNPTPEPPSKPTYPDVPIVPKR